MRAADQSSPFGDGGAEPHRAELPTRLENFKILEASDLPSSEASGFLGPEVLCSVLLHPSYSDVQGVRRVRRPVSEWGRRKGSDRQLQPPVVNHVGCGGRVPEDQASDVGPASEIGPSDHRGRQVAEQRRSLGADVGGDLV